MNEVGEADFEDLEVGAGVVGRSDWERIRMLRTIS